MLWVRAMRLSLALVIPIALAACQAVPVTDAPVGRATARISQVPDGVRCVALTVVGDRTVMHSADVAPGQPAFLQFDDLPVGLDAFSAAAFGTSCALISGVQPSWATGQPFYAAITQGGVTPLTLTLQPTGGAVIGIDWGDGGAPPADMTAPPDGFGTQPDGFVYPQDFGPPDLSPWTPDGGWHGPDLAY